MLAYSFEGVLDLEVPGARAQFQAYSNYITSFSTHTTTPSPNVRHQWESLLHDDFEGGMLYGMGHQAGPLLTTTWGYSNPYNQGCPYDSVSNSHTSVGSEAVAMAQLLRYWQRPLHGHGFHSYTDPSYGLQQATFSSATYQWNLMPSRLVSWSGTASVNAVSQLMYHCGVAMETQYGILMSHAQLTSTDTSDHHSMQNALWRHFGFKKTLHPVYQDSISFDQWVDSLYFEIDQARPVPCCSYSNTDSTYCTFIVDGYDPIGCFHINWGWDGTSNGYYLLDALPHYGTHQVMLAGAEPNGALRSNGTTYNFSYSGGICSPHIYPDTTSTLPWAASTSASWITVSPSSGNGPVDTLTVIVDSNHTYLFRSAIIVVQQGGDTLHINISQQAFYFPMQSEITLDTLRMACTITQGNSTDTLFPGIHYVIVNPGDSTTYPSPCNSWLNLLSVGGPIIIDSVIYDIKQDSDYLQLYDLDYRWWDPKYSFSGQGTQYNLLLYGSSATVRFHSDCYVPHWGYRIHLHICDTAMSECRNVTAIATNDTTIRVMWSDTSFTGPWYIFSGDSPYNLHLADSSNQTSYDMTNVDILGTYYFSVFRHPSYDYCTPLTSPRYPCDYYNTIYNLHADNVHTHSADISWGDYNPSSVWYVFWYNWNDYILHVDSSTSPFLHIDSLINDTWYEVYVSNRSATNAIDSRCNYTTFWTPRCETDSISCRDIQIDSITSSSAIVTWAEFGTGTQWYVVFENDYGIRDTILCDTLRCQLTGLHTGLWHQVTVFNNTDFPIGNSCAIWESFYTPCVSPQNCIGFTDLNSCMVTATCGSFGDPYSWYYVWNEGSDSPYSRHTVYRDADSSLTDPRTGGLLRIIPQGDTATIRLGNWLSGAEAESITYAYDVDTSFFDLLTMRYAAVLENPGHNFANQPRFTFRIKDEDGNDINAGCYSADFIADSSLGWNVNGHVLWKDWTNVGIDLDPLHGRRIYIQLTTYDCAEGSHFGYAYFNFHCGEKNLIADRCGSGVNTIAAPEGFNYQWRDIVTDSVVSTSRIITLSQSDNLYCHLSFVGANADSCGFDMFASSAFRYPNASFGYQLADTVDCQQLIRFSDSSFVSHFANSTYQTHNQCDSVQWSFGDGSTSTQRNPEHLYRWGEYDVVQVASIDNGDCSDTLAVHLVVMPTCPVYDTIRYILCHGDTIQFHTLSLTDSGTYTYIDGMFYHTAVVILGTTYASINDTIVQNQLPYAFNGNIFDDTVIDRIITLPRSNIYGCDSVITYSLFYYPNERTFIDTIVCPYEVPFIWNDILITDDYHDSIILHTIHGADSIVHLSLTVSRELKAVIGLNHRSVNLYNYCDIQLSNQSTSDTLRTWYLPDGTDTRNKFQYCYPINYGYDSINVMLVVESILGCHDTDLATIQLEVPAIYAPNVFTPSRHTNNRFYFVGKRIATLSVDIYDRRGVFLYHWDGIDGSWDGTSSNIPLPQGAYVWYARYTTTATPAEVLTLTGTVVLVR